MIKTRAFFKKNAAYVLLFTAVFFSDLITKLVFYYITGTENELFLGEHIIITPVLNNHESYRIINLFLENGQNIYFYTLMISIIAILFASFITVLNIMKVPNQKKILYSAGFYLFVSFITDLIAEKPFSPEMSYHTSLWISLLSVTVFFISIFMTVHLKTNKLLLITVIAAGCGNLVNLFYPPWFPIDFIYIPGLFQGIFNLADLFYLTALIFIITLNSGAFMIWLFKLLRNIYSVKFSRHMPAAVIFDMDGVLVDSEPVHFDAETEIFRKIGADFTDEERSAFVGTSIRGMYSDIKKRFDISYSVEELITNDKKFRLEYFSKLDKLDPVEGIVPLLNFLKRNNIRAAIASSSTMDVITMIVSKLGIADYFDFYISGDDVIHGKPAPDIFLAAAERLGTDIKQCVIIEDSKNGIAAAKAAGISSIGYINPNSGNQDLTKADWTVKSIKDIDAFHLSRLIKLNNLSTASA